MITCDSFKKVLSVMQFKTTDENFYSKSYDSIGAEFSVDFRAEKLIYPPTIKGRERNDSFDKPENFVVFECVNRLIEKGYRPESIELEKEWHLGHDTKSGRADILVSSKDGSILFIIECKTWGKEFDKALNDTKNDGAQLFSYWQQEQSCKWLILYSSDLKNGQIECKAPTIDCSDDANIILLSKKDKSIKLYRGARTTEERFEAWKETYGSQIHDDLIFSEDSVAYRIGVKPLLKKNLKDFTPDDKIVNKFEEILRHNNVSDKENAFNRLIALFICKLVDEITKGDNDEVEFQYKQGTDTYETLQDRLQRLHRDGMEKFMKEEIYYVSADYPEWLFSTYTGSKRKKAIEDLQNTIRILKFYSNNDFAFKDVHNEELFYQNGKILVEMVQLFEKYRIVYHSKHQFLGDLFEQLLNKGFKQNEGQFFTPMPITRFIWDSLPVERMVKSDRGTVFPKVIDYACGAGHFLTEAIEAINFFVQSDDNNNAWTRDHIFGIEKDYRLARVAKISLFMNGAGEGNIIFGDGLENTPDNGIDNNAFDILVANPPYSVKDFKQHLQLKNNTFRLLDKIGLNSGEIESLFVERIAQLLKPKGIAAVILPNSILSNDSASYTGAREEILKNFYIRGIAAFGSKTFGATGQNTVVMFLEKFNEPPKQVDLVADSVDAIISGEVITDWKDKEILEAYVSQIEIEEETYNAFLHKDFSMSELSNSSYLQMYVSAFSNSSDARNLTKSKAYQNKNAEEQAKAYLDKFYSYALSIEKEKLFYFALVYRQATVIITAPTDNKAQKEFLGYDWSNRKGNEGIQIITPGGMMYDDGNRIAEGTLANSIKLSFEGMEPTFSEEQQEYGLVVDTKDILDFSRSSFNKSISLYGKRIPKYNSKYPLASLGRLSNEPKYGANEAAVSGNPDVDYRYIRITDITDDGYLGPEWMTAENIDNQYILQDGDFLFARTGATAGKYFLYESKYGKAIYAGYLIRFHFDNSVVLPKYIKFVLRLKPYTEWAEYNRRGRNINATRYSAFQIPLPPISIQQKIVDECTKIDDEYDSIRISIEGYKNKIETLFGELDNVPTERGGKKFSLADSNSFEITIGKRVLDKQLSSDGTIPVYSANVIEPFGHINDHLLSDFSVPSILWGIDGDWMTGLIPPNEEFYPTDHCGVLRSKTEAINPYYLCHIVYIEGNKMGFSRSYRASIDRVKGISFYVPPRGVQDKTVNEIQAIERKIKELNDTLKKIEGKITKIVDSYLR